MTTTTETAPAVPEAPAPLDQGTVICAACGKPGLRAQMTADGPEDAPVPPRFYCGREGTEAYHALLAGCEGRQAAARAACAADRAAEAARKDAEGDAEAPVVQAEAVGAGDGGEAAGGTAAPEAGSGEPAAQDQP